MNSGNAVDLGTLAPEQHRKVSTLTPLTLFGLNSSDTDVFDYGGVVRTIVLTGTITGTPASLKTAKDNLEAFLNGSQTTQILYSSDFQSTTYKVKMQDLELHFEPGDTRTLYYTMTLIESSSNG